MKKIKRKIKNNWKLWLNKLLTIASIGFSVIVIDYLLESLFIKIAIFLLILKITDGRK